MPMSPDELQLTAHCLLRLTTALMLESVDVPHGLPTATEELNTRTGRQLSSREWLHLLEPHYRRRFAPGEDTLRLI
jgi:hypothetical protein